MKMDRQEQCSQMGDTPQLPVEEASVSLREAVGLFLQTVNLTPRSITYRSSLARAALVYGSVVPCDDGAQRDIDLLFVADDLPIEELFARVAPSGRSSGGRSI